MSLVEKNAADQIAAGASSESEVWASALIDAPDWEPVFSPLAPAHLALGLETGLAPFGRLQRVGAMATLFMRKAPVRNLSDAQAANTDRYGALFRHVLERGIYFPPSQFEALFITIAHGNEEIERTVQAVADFDA